MKKLYGSVALVIGASSGVGKACAEFLHKYGYKVYGTSRKVEFPDSEIMEDGIVMVPLEVTDSNSIKKVVDYIIGREGEINLLINCPGYGLSGAVEDISLNEVREIFETNLFGIMMVCRNVLPYMRENKKGLIVNISSVAGIISIPYQSMYSATKYALEAVSEAMRIEVKPFGVKVALIEPGDMKTNFIRIAAKDADENSVYKLRYEKAVDEMIKSEENGPEAEVVIKELKRILKKRNPSLRNIVGMKYKLIGKLRKLLPERLLELIISNVY
ncbi:SDR family oxidoreductase [Oceanirhabdus sp. W0125-5]|uniref:SDR family oxidoreductase n=1 Tax=Oceanirhabdus sp. W0125-5 TaxID=2999116 RepID=UPI0022F2CD21|nr:SDR family oxidoreductase [Oceanirhabdus sp. W0125-5]WBW99013.1 SDR family oxidoreductase [Oceanirhabdus sp. W0125-5]